MQVDHLHWSPGAFGCAQRRNAGDEDAEVLPRRNVGLDRIVQRDLALFDQHHERDAGERLGHRIDAEDRVDGQRRVALDVSLADSAEVSDLAVPRDEGHCARQSCRVST